MRNKSVTQAYYVNQLGFRVVGNVDYADYLMVEREGVQLHFFAFRELDPGTNYGQVYIRTDAIDTLYNTMLENGVPIHPAGPLHQKPWGQMEFSLLDPDNNLLTFGQAI